MRCAVCKRNVRITQRVYTSELGVVKRAHCCSGCIKREGLTIVAIAPKPKEDVDLAKSVARTERELLKSLDTWLRGQVDAYTRSYNEVRGDREAEGVPYGRIEAYESVREKIKQGKV